MTSFSDWDHNISHYQKLFFHTNQLQTLEKYVIAEKPACNERHPLNQINLQICTLNRIGITFWIAHSHKPKLFSGDAYSVTYVCVLSHFQVILHTYKEAIALIMQIYLQIFYKETRPLSFGCGCVLTLWFRFPLVAAMAHVVTVLP